MPLGRSDRILPQVRAALAAGRRARAGACSASRCGHGPPPGARQPARRGGAVGRRGAGRRDALPRVGRGGAGPAGPGGRQRRRIARGRERLHRPDALAPEVAQLALRRRRLRKAASANGSPAIRRMPGYRMTAVSTLSQAPDSLRSDLLSVLSHEHDLAARRLEADLRARWGDPLGALDSLQAAIPPDSATAVEALRGLGDLLRTVRRPSRAPGPGPDLRADRRSEPRAASARAFDWRRPAPTARRASATPRAACSPGSRTTARRRERSPAGASAHAGPGAYRRREARRGRAPAGRAPRPKWPARNTPRSSAAWCWATSRPATWATRTRSLGGDSTVDGLALAGRLRLYRGDIPGAIERFKAAGPFAGERDEATERTALLALLQPIEADSLPALGQALFALARGDTARAVAGLDKVARRPAAGEGRRRGAPARGAARGRRPERPVTRSGCSRPPPSRPPRARRRPPSWPWPSCSSTSTVPPKRSRSWSI